MAHVFDDFFKGVDFFLNCDEEKLNSKIMSAVPKPQIIKNDTEYLPVEYDSKRISVWQILTLGGHLIPACFMDKTESDISAVTDDYRQCFRHMVIRQYAGQDKCYVMSRNFGRFIKSVGSVMRIAFKIIFMYNRTKREYVSRKSEITSESFWEKHLGLDIG